MHLYVQSGGSAGNNYVAKVTSTMVMKGRNSHQINIH